jgi:hypothetical protein
VLEVQQLAAFYSGIGLNYDDRGYKSNILTEGPSLRRLHSRLAPASHRLPQHRGSNPNIVIRTPTSRFNVRARA